MGTQPALEALRASLHAAPIPVSGLADAPASAASRARLQVLQHFSQVFAESTVTDPKDMEAAFRLRFQVYCLDRKFESAAACPDGLEHDAFDSSALHSLLRDRATGTPLGTVRLVRPSATAACITTLPLAEYASEESLGLLRTLPVGRTAEVSRFAIARAARDVLRGPAASISDGAEAAARELATGEALLPYMSLGLIRGLVRLSVRHGITHWCLAAEPSLLRRLRNFGLHFENAGPLVEHRGLRQVCFAGVGGLLEQAEAERPEFWEVITDGGRLLANERARNAA